MSRESYELIAKVYATDMGQSMAFDDVGYYRALCLARGGHTLELGCGTGRILLPLMHSGIDIAGVDQSPAMLAELQLQAQALQLQPALSLGTLTAFSTLPCHTILAPYSVVTYLTDVMQLALFFRAVRQGLAPAGMLVLDTFVPRPIIAFTGFRLDYQRPHQGRILQREKRITGQDGCNRIERRYSLLDTNGGLERSWLTVDVIRPWTGTELREAARAEGFTLIATHGDFTTSAVIDPQFVVQHYAID